ncbi:MAG: glycosyltransferase family 9 protein [Cyanobacteria bacterium RM1_2_2]|nr:glycosyltransferase family 9 protein [Cyanobacteria bacterium RM1_2_2]
MRVVALVPGGIGDQLLFFPTLDALKQNYPDAEIDVVVEPQAKAAYRVSKSVNDVLTFDFKDRNSPADWANLLGVLRDRDYEAVISSSRDWGTKLLLWLTGIPTRVGYAGSGGGFFLTNSVTLKPDQPTVHQYYDLLQVLGVTAPCPELDIRLPKADQDWADAERKRLGVNGYVLIYGGNEQLSPGLVTSYPIESWQKIIQDFQQKQPELPLVLLQSPENTEFVAALTQANPGIKVTKPTDPGKMGAMIAGANLMLCTESAPMYLAVALQVYTLALFGATNPDQQLPKTDKFLGIQSTTGKLADISPEQVLQKVWGG